MENCHLGKPVLKDPSFAGHYNIAVMTFNRDDMRSALTGSSRHVLR